MIEATFTCVEVGNWYSEYECSHCQGHTVVDDEDATPKTCPKCGAKVL